MVTKTSLSKEPMLYIGFMGGPIVTKDLVGPRTLGESVCIPWIVAEQESLMKLHFMQTGWLPTCPCLYILPDCRVQFFRQGIFVGKGEPLYDWIDKFSKEGVQQKRFIFL